MSIHNWFFVFILTSFQGTLLAQNALFGTNQFIEYQPGELPIVLSVAHGGNLEPNDIPDRTCNNAVTVTDAFTLETALALRDALIASTGCAPHVIICHLSRRKLDCNRNILEGACGDPQAELAWNEFHNFITTARNTANATNDFKTLFVDVHGHGNPIDRIELGYLLYDDELELPDNTLNSSAYVGYSSIQNLVQSNANGYSHVALLRGPMAFGTLLSNVGYPAVPSEQIPYPGVNSNYFSGGYITANHTCYNANAAINGFQMELNYTGIRDNQTNREGFAQGFSQAIQSYMSTHFNMIGNNCLSSGMYAKSPDGISIFPNVLLQGDDLWIQNSHPFSLTFNMVDQFGKLLFEQEVAPDSQTGIGIELESGCYHVNLFAKDGSHLATKRVMVLD